jgi:hypothetical protein
MPRVDILMRIHSNTDPDAPKEPRWLAIIAMLATGLVYAALPSSLSVGPDWLLLAVMGALVVAAAILHRVGYHGAVPVSPNELGDQLRPRLVPPFCGLLVSGV